MSDLIDVLSPAGLRTGELLPRREIHRLGKHHRAVHLYVLNSRDELLMQRRSYTVDHFPGGLGISVTGHVDAGEFSSQAVRREFQEELGLDPTAYQFDFLFSFFQEVTLSETYIDRQFNDVYMTRIDIDAATIRFDPAETAEFLWKPFAWFTESALSDHGEMAPVYGRAARDLVYFVG